MGKVGRSSHFWEAVLIGAEVDCVQDVLTLCPQMIERAVNPARVGVSSLIALNNQLVKLHTIILHIGKYYQLVSNFKEHGLQVQHIKLEM